MLVPESIKAEQQLRPTQLAILVDDRDAVCPIRIEPTFSDEYWISMGGFPGASGSVFAAVVDSAGHLYIGGFFKIVGDVAANNIANWDGTYWSKLGSGVNGNVQAVAVSGTDLYVGGEFETAGGKVSAYLAKVNPSPKGPSVSAIDRLDPSGAVAKATTLIDRVTFNESVNRR